VLTDLSLRPFRTVAQDGQFSFVLGESDLIWFLIAAFGMKDLNTEAVETIHYRQKSWEENGLK
jgi:hypothetical protein